MPEIEFSGSVSIDVYCADCGAGICNNSNYYTRNNRLDVSCPICKKANEDVIKSLEIEKEELTEHIEVLKTELEIFKNIKQ